MFCLDMEGGRVRAEFRHAGEKLVGWCHELWEVVTGRIPVSSELVATVFLLILDVAM